MYIEKLKSGNYRCTLKVGGKTYRKTIDHKPTKHEQETLFADEVFNAKDIPSATLESACAEYMRVKAELLSPTTIKGYNIIIKRIDPYLMSKKLAKITRNDLQAEANRVSREHAPKTVHSHIAFIRGVLRHFDADIDNSITLPQKTKIDPYIPTDDDVKELLSHLGSEYQVVVRLLCCGLRLSEACALTIDDLDGNLIAINKAIVYGDDKEFHLKTTKTTDSTRTIAIPEELADMIRKQGYVYNGSPLSINKTFHRVQDQYHLKKFSPHKLRHYFCSKCIDLGLDIFTIQKLGGWSNSDTPQRIYAHMMREKEKNKMVTDALSKALF